MSRLRTLVLSIAALALVGLPTATAGAAPKAKKVAVVHVSGGATAIVLDQQTAGGLSAAGISVAPIGRAEATDDGAITFPISSGRLAGKHPAAGAIRHGGGLRLSSATTHVDLNQPRIEDGKVPSSPPRSVTASASTSRRSTWGPRRAG